MKRDVTVWIDHREAVFATLTDKGEATSRLESNVEKHVGFSAAAEHGAEDQYERRYEGHLRKYFDAVISRIRDAEAILILGPGEAKHQLEKRLREEGLGGRIVAVVTTDKMTHPQIAARARQQFLRKESDPA
jgi:stalled ribosome rescue protein Dom34